MTATRKSFDKSKRLLLSEDEAAALCGGVCRKTFIEIAKSKGIPFILQGRSRFYDPKDLVEYIEGNKQSWPSENEVILSIGGTTSRSAVVDIEDLRARRQKGTRSTSKRS
jgi:hypothetical protein